MHWQNTVEGYCEGKESICAQTRKFLRDNARWIKKKVKAKARRDPYWHQVSTLDKHTHTLIGLLYYLGVLIL